MDGTTFSMYLQGATLLNNTFPGASAFGLEIRKTLDHFISQGAIGNLSATREDSYGIFMNLWYFRCCLVWKTSCFAWYWMIMLWPLPPLRNRKPKKAHRWLATFQTGDRWFMDGLWMVYGWFIVIYCYYTLGPIRKSKLTFSMSGTQLQESVKNMEHIENIHEHQSNQNHKQKNQHCGVGTCTHTPIKSP